MGKESKMSRFEDRLNLLPDDILINNILPLLPMNEAARTSILARRWRFLWLYTPSLDLEAGYLAAHGCYRRGNFFPGFRKKDYVTWVDRVIRGYRGSAALRLFRLQFPLHGFHGRWDASFSGKLDSWIRFSLGKGVEVLDVSIHWERGQKQVLPYKLPSVQPHQFPNIRLLKSLTLRDVPVSIESLEHFLLGCEFLERLQLKSFHSLTRVNITGTLSRLKSIHISGSRNLEAIMIYAPTPDLASFTYPVSSVKHLHIEHAPRLVELSMGQIYDEANFCLTSHRLFRYVSQLEVLHLSLPCWDKAIHWLPHLPDLSRLKHLKLGICSYEPFEESAYARGLASFIKAAPCVQHLTLTVLLLDPVETLNMAKEFANLRLQNLRVIEIIRYRGENFECVLALHLIKAAVSLEKLIVHCWHSSVQPGAGSFNNLSWTTIKEAKKCAKEVFGPKLTSKAKLVLI